MFDQVVDKPRTRPWTTAVIIGSAVAHGLVAAAVVIAGMWKIEALPFSTTTPITMASRMPLPDDSGPPPGKPGQLKPPPATKPPKVIVKGSFQPTPQREEPPPTTVETGDPTAPPGGGGGGGGDHAGTPCASPPCSPDGIGELPAVAEPEPEPPPVIKPVNVSPDVARGLRLSGNEQIYPPESVKVEMVHQDLARVQGTFQLCVGTEGRIDSIRTIKSTGFPAYDDTLLGEMRQWRYRPYLVAGVPAPMCAVEIVVYRMRK